MELDDSDQPDKCEKVILEIISRKDLMITITVYISTGRIHVSGHFFKEWGSDEFENIVKMVNSGDEEMKIEHDDSFLEIIARGKSKTCAVDKQNTSTENSQTTPVNSPRDKTFTMIKQHLSNLEVDFISFKEDTNTKMKQLNETIEKKDENITLLNSEIRSLKLLNKEKDKTISDLSSKQLCMEEQIEKLITELDKNKQQLKNACKKQSNTNSAPAASTSQPPTTANQANNDKSCSYNVSTANKFDTLANQEVTDSSPSQTNPEKSKNESAPKSQNPKHNHNNYKPVETIILCDSNGRYLDPTLLCPDSPTQYIRCPTLPDATNIIKNSNYTHAKCFILHCGTNDLEKVKSEEELLQLTENVVKTINKKYPLARIIVSGLLPRQDALNDKVTPFNSNLQKTLTANVQNITFVTHNNIKPYHLKDKKHLLQNRVKNFARNLKAAFFNTTPKKARRKPDREIPNRREPHRRMHLPTHQHLQTHQHPPTHQHPHPTWTNRFTSKSHFHPSTQHLPQYSPPWLFPNNQKTSSPLPAEASNHVVELVKELYKCLN